ncbi:MAG: hypothetical protein ACE5I1_31190 [bacterium]
MALEAKLKAWLQALLKGSISHTELANLVHFCRAIAESYLVQHRSSLVHVCALNGLTVTDLAYDCIAQIFARNEDGRFYQLERFADSLHSNLEETPQPELFLAFKSFVLKIARTQLAKIYAQSDPAGAKIHRNIKDCIKKSDSLRLVEDFRGYVLQPAKHNAHDYLTAYPLDQLERELLARAGRVGRIPELLEEVASILIEQEKYRRTIRLIDAVQIFKQLYIQIAHLSATTEVSAWKSDGLSQLDLEIIQRDVRRAVQEKIISTYLLPGKVNKTEAEALSNIMLEIIADWCQDPEQQYSFYQYVQRHLAISQSEYEAMWRTKLEYLSRIAREKFAACITKDI